MNRRPSRVDVPALLARLGIEATRSGRVHKAPCPFPWHEEHEPSWSIVDAPGSEKHGAHWCFGCGTGGGPRALVREVLELGRCDCAPRRTCAACKKAIEFLKGAATVEIPAEVPRVLLVSPRGDPKLEIPEGVEFGPLDRWPSVFRKYAVERGLTAEQIARWQIGYAVAGRLEMRLFIPVWDETGRLRSWTARTLIGARERYMTPTRREGALHGAVFGRAHWPPADASGRLPGVVLVGEGGFDALALERAAPGHPIGAVLGGQHEDPAAANQLARFYRAVLATDGDPAGDKIFRELSGKLEPRTRVERAILPKGADPASLPTDELSSALYAALKWLPAATTAGDESGPPF